MDNTIVEPSKAAHHNHNSNDAGTGHLTPRSANDQPNVAFSTAAGMTPIVMNPQSLRENTRFTLPSSPDQRASNHAWIAGL